MVDGTLMQVESGLKLITHCSDSVFVFGTLWPSWFFAARAHGFRGITVHVEDLSPGSRLALEAVMKDEGDVMLTKEEWCKELGRVAHGKEGRRVVVLMQGPESSLALVRKQLIGLWNNTLKNLKVLAVVTPKWNKEAGEGFVGRGIGKSGHLAFRSDDKGSVFKLDHRMVGGIVNASWTFVVNESLSAQQEENITRVSKVVARLPDFLSTTECGAAINEPKMLDEGRVAWKRRKLRVKAESVFSKTRWVERLATIRELMLMYDIGVQEVNVMLEACNSA